MSTLTPGQKRGLIQAAKGEAMRAALIEEIEWLLYFDAGEGRILQALGYSRNPHALERKLYRYGRGDLIPRIFEYAASVDEQQHPKRSAAA